VENAWQFSRHAADVHIASVIILGRDRPLSALGLALPVTNVLVQQNANKKLKNASLKLKTFMTTA